MERNIATMGAPLLLIAAALALPGEGADGAARRAAGRFAAALAPASREKACLPFDDARRLDWHFIPRERGGLPLGAMADGERRAAHELLRAFLSPRGYLRALGVIELEEVLRAGELAAGRDGAYRDPGRYFFTLFGETGGDGPWMARVEGHHLALNFTGDAEHGVATTPFFLGSNPAEVRAGPKAGFSLLAVVDERARALLEALSEEQRRAALVATTAPADVLFGPQAAQPPAADEGVALKGVDAPIARLVAELLETVTGDVAVAPPVAAEAAQRFVWAGGRAVGEGHYWRLQGERVVVEYDNTQDGANHAHLLWRDPRNDFGRDWLARHHRDDHGGGGDGPR